MSTARNVLWRAAALALAAMLAGCSTPATESVAPTLAVTQPSAEATSTPEAVTTLPTPEAATRLPTPACSADPTPSLTEGPYFTPGSPERTSLLEPDMTGTRIVISGYVLSTDCQPIPGARVDFWQADADGEYDNAGYMLRGNQTTDANGRYTLETIVPGVYPGRTRHYHVKVEAPGGPILTTQLFFPDELLNASDNIFSSKLLLNSVQETADGLTAAFDFVVAQN